MESTKNPRTLKKTPVPFSMTRRAAVRRSVARPNLTVLSGSAHCTTDMHSHGQILSRRSTRLHVHDAQHMAA